MKAAIDEGVPAPVISTALYERFASRGEADFAGKMLSAMRSEFGGHVERTGKSVRSIVGHAMTTAARSDALVLFGASGDLAHKKIFPALYAMCRRGKLDVPIVGVAKSGWTLDELREHATRCGPRGGRISTKQVFARFAGQMRYVDGDYRAPETFQELRAALAGAKRPLHYLAIPPSMFPGGRRGPRPRGRRRRTPASSSRSRSGAISNRRGR